jgi:ribosomal protein L29
MLGCAMVEQSENLVLEILRRMQSDIAEMKTDIRDIKGQLIDIRTQLVTMQSDALRQERTVAALQVKVDRIETRLDFTDH